MKNFFGNQNIQLTGYGIMRYLLVVLLYFAVFDVSAQNTQKIDSLEALLPTAIEDTNRVNIYNELFLKYKFTDNIKAKMYIDQALSLSKQIDYKKGLAKTYIYFGFYYEGIGNYAESIIYSKKALEIFERTGDRGKISLCLNNIGLVYNNRGDYTKALEYFLKSLKLNEELDDKKEMAKSYNNIGNVHYVQNNLTEAIKYYKKSAKIRESIGDRQGISGSYSNIGGICFKQQKYDEALEYFKKSISINEELGDKKGLSKGYNNIGLIYKSQGKYSLALEYYKKSLKIKEAFGDKNGIALVRGCITSLYLVQADSSKNTEQKTDLYNKAVKNAESSLEIVKEIGALPHENSIYEDLYHAWSGLKNYKNAFEYSQKYIATKDSLFNSEKIKVIEEMETKYQTEKKEKENELLIKDNEIKKLALEKQTTLRNFFVMLSAFVILLVVFTFYRLNLKKKANRILVIKNELITKQKIELSKTLVQLNESNATKDKFFSIIGHDLRSPLQAIIGFSELLKYDKNQLYTEKMREKVDRIYNAGKSTSNLLSNLLDWSRSQTGAIEFKPERFYLRSTVECEIDILSINSSKKGINISVNIPKNLEVFADKNMISTVIRNLISNAIKFTYDKGNILISGLQKNENIETTVSDTGTGIDPVIINKIFNIDFTSSAKGTNDETGTGLGLVLCKDFIERNNGKISVQSTPGKGSNFIFTLPYAEKYVEGV